MSTKTHTNSDTNSSTHKAKKTPFKKLMPLLTKTVSKEDTNADRRDADRRNSDPCVSVIRGKSYQVENWSLGGMLLSSKETQNETPDFDLNENIELTLKFKLGEALMNVDHQGSIVRKSDQKVAVHFSPLTKAIRQKFQHVIDDYVTREFSDTHIV